MWIAVNCTHDVFFFPPHQKQASLEMLATEAFASGRLSGLGARLGEKKTWINWIVFFRDQGLGSWKRDHFVKLTGPKSRSSVFNLKHSHDSEDARLHVAHLHIIPWMTVRLTVRVAILFWEASGNVFSQLQDGCFASPACSQYGIAAMAGSQNMAKWTLVQGFEVTSLGTTQRPSQTARYSK